ncbi:hypothetical protein DM02DRAFT_101925 [Periconia macrospinosa]|uniref:Zinc finger PHD-type domain-containing protein n=1 Tax=Periconia macrospinosa TaxID=97972 RepID=A0A2V1DFS4_9PLEO|nr:hypothetical protein DM02DRAFT_101925 [Periconia macrospinosa]
MSLDQHLHGPSDWHFPSPTSTPKSHTFTDSSLKTPKTDAFPPSYFLDAWSTPVVNGHQTPAQTPCFTLSTPIDRPSTSQSLQVRTPEDPDFHVNHFAAGNLPLPPVDPARRLSSSPDPHLVKQAGFLQGSNHTLRPRPVSMDTSQMQTPPPTRHATSRRSLQLSTGGNGNDVATPATVIHQTPAQMPPVDGLFGQTPFGFPGLQFSPDLGQQFSTGPMSAPPLLPQSRLFWDHPNDSSQMDVEVPLTHDPFGPTPHKMDGNNNWSTFQATPTANNTLNSQSFQALHEMSSTAGPMDSFTLTSNGGDNSRPHSLISPSGGVDPNMLFSFSSEGPAASFDSSFQMPQLQIKNRQPYATQLEDSLSEKESARKSRGQHSRTSTNSSSSLPGSRPSLQRKVNEAARGGDSRRSSEHDLRRQYPGLWADDDSDSEEENTTLSRNTSFNMPRRRTSKHARIDNDGFTRSDSFKMPRSSSRPSSGVYDQSSFDTIRPTRRVADHPNRRFSMMDFPSNFGGGLDNQDQSMPDSPGDALGALKRVIEGRQKNTDNSAQNTLRAHNQRWAQASADFANANSSYDPFPTSFTASPSNSAETGLTTPSTDRSSLSGDSVRCVCNGGDDGLTMIQCESCNKWLHMGCVGLNQRSVPPVYVCVYCTGQTPIARGGRIRGPVPGPFDSPLTHKSVFRR